MNSRMQATSSKYNDMDPTISHQIDMVCLITLYIGFFSCLIRSDYNFAIIFFLYFVWQQRKDSYSVKLMLASIIILIIYDVLFIFVQMRVWISNDDTNPVWGTLKGMHYFGIVCFTVIMIMKFVLLFFTIKANSKTNSAVQPL